MTKLAMAAVVLAFAGPALAGTGEDPVAVKVTVKGMSCPDGCGAKIAKSLKGIEGAKEVTLTDFEKGLFTVSFDAKAAVKPSAI